MQRQNSLSLAPAVFKHQELPIICSVMLLTEPGLALVQTVLSRNCTNSACTVRMDNLHQTQEEQAAAAGHSHRAMYKLQLPCVSVHCPFPQSCALTWPFLNSSSLQNAEDRWAWALCLAVWENDGWVLSTGRFPVTNVFWRIYLYLGRDSVLLVLQKRRRRECKSTTDLLKVGASCCPLQVQVTKPVLSHRLKNHIERCVCLKGCCGENPLHHALAYPCWWQAIAVNFSELIQVKTK